MNVEYCFDVLFQMNNTSCYKCGLHGSKKCEEICKEVEKKLKTTYFYAIFLPYLKIMDEYINCLNSHKTLNECVSKK